MTISLDSLVTGIQKRPVRILLYGADGIGKSSFAAESENPIFLAPEDGTAHLDVTRFERPKDWADLLAAVADLYEKDHKFQTLVIDTVDWAEHIARDYVCKNNDVSSIESIPYGKGWVFTQELFTSLLRGLDALYMQGMNIICIAHAEVKQFNDPEHESYDRYMVKMDKRTAPILREWADYVLFTNYDTSLKKVGDGLKQQTKAVSFGKRIIHTQRTAAFDAKRRFNIPDRIPLSWASFYEAHKAASEPTTTTTEEE